MSKILWQPDTGLWQSSPGQGPQIRKILSAQSCWNLSPSDRMIDADIFRTLPPMWLQSESPWETERAPASAVCNQTCDHFCQSAVNLLLYSLREIAPVLNKSPLSHVRPQWQTKERGKVAAQLWWANNSEGTEHVHTLTQEWTIFFWRRFVHCPFYHERYKKVYNLLAKSKCIHISIMLCGQNTDQFWNRYLSVCPL